MLKVDLNSHLTSHLFVCSELLLWNQNTLNFEIEVQT